MDNNGDADIARPPPATLLPTCRGCDAVLEDDGVVRVRNRKRFCPKCRNGRAVAKRKQNPVSRLQHRWFNSASKLWPNADTNLWSIHTVQRVYKRWQQRCVITGDTDIQHLCVSYYRARKEDPPQIDELVLLSTHQAQRLAASGRNDPKWRREDAFPEDVQDELQFSTLPE